MSVTWVYQWQWSDRLRNEATAAVVNLTEEIVDSLNGDVSEMFYNQVIGYFTKTHSVTNFPQKKLAKKCKKLQIETNTFTKQTAEWLSLIDTFNKSFKVGKEMNFKFIVLIWLFRNLVILIISLKWSRTILWLFLFPCKKSIKTKNKCKIWMRKKGKFFWLGVNFALRVYAKILPNHNAPGVCSII